MASNRILEGYCSHGVKVIRRGMRHLRNGRCVRKGARLRDRRRLRLCPRLRLRLRRCRSSLQRRASILETQKVYVINLYFQTQTLLVAENKNLALAGANTT